jgi:hypothetical protein
MAGRVSEVVLADALLVVAELVTNSVRHADAATDAAITVRAELRPDVLHVAVADRGRGPVRRRAPDLVHGGGLGLNIVQTLSACWGVDRAGGTRVWAELACAQSTDGRPTLGGGTTGDSVERGGGPGAAALLTSRAHAAVLHAAAACAASARAHDDARRACDRRAERGRVAGGAGGASALPTAAWPMAASPVAQ